MNSKRIWNFIKAVTGNIPLLKNIAVYSTSKRIGNFGEIMHLMWIHLLLIVGLCDKVDKCPERYRFNPDHVACLKKSPKCVEAVEVSAAEQYIILTIHNHYREDVNPKPCSMFPLYWNVELAFLAQQWANNCEFKKIKREYNKVPGRYNVDQNIGMGYTTWDGLLRAWHTEMLSFNNSDPREGVADSYKKMIRSTSHHIGCAVSICSNLGDFRVCNYAPVEDPKEPIYKECKDEIKIFKCHNEICYNGGHLDPDTCKCTCYDELHIISKDCSLNCTFPDPSDPCDAAKKSICAKFETKFKCPWMCNECNVKPISARNKSDGFSFIRQPLRLRCTTLLMFVSLSLRSI
ncbi:cysteine-rich venom protein pseudechetoxin-like [Octopus bimaculoides]|uniref:SCP domain-containing protein n=1 Tax=Octopus bimaculoides TaxID=37653 RepID=A0A0L8HB49_OCTBM|nr:cysteine-rich venom protein pseudechetoxin-like [Octopus bimaculoides]|eukprot:XP_014774226.1 PREDICTED: cysteine-rich venom protein pseudechetoxin-like [Octopus bimaculoides]